MIFIFTYNITNILQMSLHYYLTRNFIFICTLIINVTHINCSVTVNIIYQQQHDTNRIVPMTSHINVYLMNKCLRDLMNYTWICSEKMEKTMRNDRKFTMNCCSDTCLIFHVSLIVTIIHSYTMHLDLE